MVGRIVGQYRIVSWIGRGGMGEVYRAEPVNGGDPVAIKLLHPERSADPNMLRRFFNEARAAATIKHPGIVEVKQFHYDSMDEPYLVMELLQGYTLRRYVDGRSKLDIPAALSICRQIAEALDAAHARGIIHRDLKPDNVFLVEDPTRAGGFRAKVLDLGIAKLADDTGDSLTAPGAWLGTVGYMSPEQFRDASKVDERADIYSLGCVLYRLVCGRLPFTGSREEVRAGHQNHAPPAPRVIDGTIPAPVQTLILKMLEKTPADRYQKMADVVRAIDRVFEPGEGPSVPEGITREESSAREESSTPAEGDRNGGTPRRRKHVFLATSSVGLALVAALVVSAMIRTSGMEAAPGASISAFTSPTVKLQPARIDAGAVSDRVPERADAGEARARSSLPSPRKVQSPRKTWKKPADGWDSIRARIR